MINDVVLMGRIQQINPDKKEVILILESIDNAVYPYKKIFIPLYISSDDLLEQVKKYCKIGDLVGVKGKIYINDSGNLYIDAWRVTFLRSESEMA